MEHDKFPDIYVMSKFPGITYELKKFLPKEANMIIVPISDQRIKWDTGIKITDEEIDFIKDAEVIVIDSMYLAKLLYQLPKVKWAQNTWAGVEMLFDNLDPTKPLPSFQATRYVDPYFGELMANYVIAQIVNLERGFYIYRDKQKTAECAVCSKNEPVLELESRPFFPDFRVLSDLTVGILGSGNLGSSIGKLLKSAGCRVMAYVRKSRESPSDSYDIATTDMNVILEQADYICNVLPSTKNTKWLLDGDILKKCCKKPVFMNIGRGDIIKEQTIIKALNEGWISKAVLDVFEQEPLPPESPLWKIPEVYITPHVGAIPRIEGIAKFIADNYMRYVKGEPLMNVIDWKQGY